MTIQQNQDLLDQVDEKDVVAYLRNHPDFFVAHCHLLIDLTVPHASGKAVSLIERQVSVLRDQNRQLRRELMDLVQIARENDRLNERLQRLTVALMETHNLSDIFFTLHDALRNDFNADIVTVRLFMPPQSAATESNELVALAFSDPAKDGLTVFKKILDAGKPVCGRLTPAQLHYLFKDKAGEIASAALVPITRQTQRTKADEDLNKTNMHLNMASDDCFGMLAIGSLDGERFHPAMGTLFLTYMSAIIGRAVMPYLKQAAPAGA